MRSFKLSQYVTRRVSAIAAAGALVLATLVFMPVAQVSAAPAVPAPVISETEKKVAEAKKAVEHPALVSKAFNYSEGPRGLRGVSAAAPTQAGQLGTASFGDVGTARISGRLTTTAGAAVVGATVLASSAVGEYWAVTNSSGNYTITGVPAGTYVVYFDSATTVTVKNLTLTENRLRVDGKIALKAQIKGTVTSTQGPIQDVFVGVYSSLNENALIAWTFTGADGNYFLHGLPAGSYKVHYQTYYVTAASYVPEWYSDKAAFAAADAVPLVTTSAIREALNVSLADGAQIRGTVYDSQGAQAVSKVRVEAYSLDGSYQVASSTVSESPSGAFVIRGLTAGTYRLMFSGGDETVAGNFRTTWLGGTDVDEESTVVTLTTAQSLSNQNVNLLAGTRIAGRVSATGVTGIAGVYVTAYGEASNYDSIANAVTDSSGNYVLRGLPTGRYHIHVDPFDVKTGSYLDQWSTGKKDYFTAIPVDTTGGNVSGQNFVLTKAAQLSGVVKNSSGAGIGGVQVSVVSATDEWDYKGYTTTAANGTYTLRGLPAGSFKVNLDPSGVSTGSYFPSWYSGKSSWATASAFTLTALQNKTGLVSVLTKAALISGKVTGASNTPLVGVEVNAFTDNGDRASGRSDEAGNYTIRGLAAGAYRLSFYGESAQNGSYLSSWYNNASTRYAASAVTVTAGQVKTGINASLTPAAVITGKVTNTSGIGIPNVDVELYSLVDQQYISYATTDGGGNYSLRGFPGDQVYTLHFDPSQVSRGSYSDRWLGEGSTGLNDADGVSIGSASGEMTVAPVALSAAGMIQGRVVNTAGAPVGRATVEITPANDEFGGSVASVECDLNGYFSLRGLSDGTYKFFINTDGVQGGGYLNGWSGSLPGATFAEARSATVAGVTPVAQGNIVATTESKITGNVIAATGESLAGVDIRVFSSTDETNPLGWATTDKNGTFSLNRLAAGSYKVTFDPRQLKTGSYRVTWSDRKLSFETATVIAVTTAETVTLNDSELISGATITGKVTAASGGKPVANVQVRAVTLEGNSTTADDAYTDASGNYTIRGLPAGSYYVQFDGNEETTGSYIRAFYGNKTSIEQNPTVIKLASLQTKAAVNFALVKAATITGTVLDSQGDPVEGANIFGYAASAPGNYIGLFARTDVDGKYVLKGVPSTGVKLVFDGTDLDDRTLGYVWNLNKATWDAADAITIVAGTTRANVNATLEDVTWTSIEGEVGLPSVVEVYNLDGIEVASVETDSQGHYVVSNLAAGTYKVKVIPSSMCFTYNWYTASNTPANNFAAGSPVTVTFRSGVTLSRIDPQPIMSDVCA